MYKIVLRNFTVNDVDMPEDKTVCFLCQSVLNYVQQAVTDPKSEAEIRTALEKSCTVVPSSFEQQCKQFVDQYGDAFISLVAQEVDPSIVSILIYSFTFDLINYNLYFFLDLPRTEALSKDRFVYITKYN